MSGVINLKGIIEEDFVNYKVPSMFLITNSCDWKCCAESKISIESCQNKSLLDQPINEYKINTIINHYMNNPITKALVFGGLEPFLQYEEIYELIRSFRQVCEDDIVIYTGYYSYEIQDQIKELSKFNNIIIKFGRYIPNQESHYDKVLGVNLVSSNQYAERIS